MSGKLFTSKFVLASVVSAGKMGEWSALPTVAAPGLLVLIVVPIIVLMVVLMVVLILMVSSPFLRSTF